MKALITGITGQDGPYLAKLLLDKGYVVYGTYRRVSTPNFWRLRALGIEDKVVLVPMDLTDTTSILKTLRYTDPDEVYNLAAQSFVEASFDQPIATANMTGVGVMRMLESVRLFNDKIKFYQAGTSEMFGTSNAPQRETTKFKPISPYATSKLFAHHTTKIYRDAYGMFCCNGILFNHESPLRGEDFVTKKIVKSMVMMEKGRQKNLVLGNLGAKRDWGYAPEYVKAMWMMLQHPKPDDYVVATGESHTVREFVESAANYAGIGWENRVKVAPRFLRPHDVEDLRGDASKIKRVLGWEPKVKFNQLVEIMMEAEYNAFDKRVRG